jgi:hypothetical protein
MRLGTGDSRHRLDVLSVGRVVEAVPGGQREHADAAGIRPRSGTGRARTGSGRSRIRIRLARERAGARRGRGARMEPGGWLAVAAAGRGDGDEHSQPGRGQDQARDGQAHPPLPQAPGAAERDEARYDGPGDHCDDSTVNAVTGTMADLAVRLLEPRCMRMAGMAQAVPGSPWSVARAVAALQLATQKPMAACNPVRDGADCEDGGRCDGLGDAGRVRGPAR